jgi:cobalt-zinc-cadmium efflux system outer membrane protein
MILLVPAVQAVTLEHVVERAVEVDPVAVVSELAWRQARIDAAEAWSDRTVSVELDLERQAVGTTTVLGQRTRVSLPVVDAAGWLDGLQHSAEARAANGQAAATALDAQYAAATLYFELLVAQRAEGLAQGSLAETEATLAVTKARADAGLEPPLHAQAAETHVVRARAELALARTGVRNARARLARAILEDVDSAEEVPLPAAPTSASTSPWIDAASARVDAARLQHAEAWAELAPVAELRAESTTGVPGWSVALRGTWSLDGIGPLLRARWAALETRRATVWRDGLRLDLDLAADTGAAEADARSQLAEAARTQEALAQAALEAGRAQLRAGLIDALDVVQLQDNLLDARRERVEAELDAARAVLEARRAAGVRW